MSERDPDGGPSGGRNPPPIEWVRPGETQPPPPEATAPAAWVTRLEDFEAAVRRPTGRPGSRRTSRPTMAGICLLLSGLLGIAGTAYSLAYPLPPEVVENLTADMDATTLAILTALAFVSLYAQAFALLGGVLAIQRSNWKLSVVCGVASLLTLGLFAFEGSLLGLLGLLLVLTSRAEFRS